MMAAPDADAAGLVLGALDYETNSGVCAERAQRDHDDIVRLRSFQGERLRCAVSSAFGTRSPRRALRLRKAPGPPIQQALPLPPFKTGP
jgi:hypothetical protein